MAVSDLGSLLPLVWKSICLNPLFQYSDIDFDSVQYLTAGWPHGCFIKITCLITAFITFERCLCTALPLKVKDIITPKRTLIRVVAIFLIMFAVVAPVFFFVNFVPSFQFERNKSLVGLSYSNNSRAIEDVSFSINMFAQLSSYIIVIACTALLIYNLRSKSQWRQKAKASSDNTDSMSSRDKRVMKMVTLISYIFLVCFLPNSVGVVMMIQFAYEFRPLGRYHNLFQATWAIINTLETINGSTSFLVYYNMSSKFRAGFKQLFRDRVKT